MPGSFSSCGGVPHVPCSIPIVGSFADAGVPFAYPFAIAGVTRDSLGNPLGNCSLVLKRTADNSVAALGASDGSGNYLLGASPAIAHQIDAYLPGSPDVAGTTVNTLVGA